MRRSLVVAVLLPALALAACGSSSNSKAASTTQPAAIGATSDGPAPAVTGAFGALPMVAKGGGAPSKALVVKVLSPGTGPAVVKGDSLWVNYLGQTFDGKVFDTSFGKSPFNFTIGAGRVIVGWDEGLVGQKVGSRVELVIPSAKGYGAQGSGAAIPPNSTLVFVVDVLGSFNATSSASGTAVALDDPALPKVVAEPGKKPAITVPAGAAAPAQLTTKTLIQGTGPAVKSGQQLIAQYVGVVWATGKQFDSSWDRGSTAAFPIGTGQVIPGWDKTLVGVNVGSRVLLVIPPADGYGASGQPAAGIKGTDTLVFVVDVLGAF